MPLNLDIPLDDTSLDADGKALLADLQGNILKGHGREHTANIFLRFDPAQAASVRAWIRGLVKHVTSSEKQFQATARRKAAIKKAQKANTQAKIPHSPPVVFFFLSASGYDALGIPTGKRPADAKFAAGQKASRSDLNDPPSKEWEKHFQDEISAMVLVGHEDDKALLKVEKALLSKLPHGVHIVGIERGLAWKNLNGDGIEHFGYVDGRSQPLLLRGDIEQERNSTDGIGIWDPAFPLKQVLVKDPGGDGPNSFGSYFVFRKLEQNVAAFKKREDEIADQLGLKNEAREIVGAMLVGRFEDGTPVVLQSAEGMHHPVPNNFDYRDDTAGMKCPFHSHIRKTNPRGESPAFLKAEFGIDITVMEERSHIMARRGITYGDRFVSEQNEEGVDFDDDKLPSGGVGLLFMAYQSDIARQFEFTQATWANNTDFVKRGTGIDPVIGQGPKGGQACPLKWGEPATKKFDFRHFVTMKGGEYFFAPSISGLANF